MQGIRIGCQTYTWHMAGPRYIGQVSHLMTVAARAGFAGMEVETIFLGDLWQPERLINRLKAFRCLATRYEKWAANYLAMGTARTNCRRTRPDLLHMRQVTCHRPLHPHT